MTRRCQKNELHRCAVCTERVSSLRGEFRERFGVLVCGVTSTLLFGAQTVSSPRAFLQAPTPSTSFARCLTEKSEGLSRSSSLCARVRLTDKQHLNAVGC